MDPSLTGLGDIVIGTLLGVVGLAAIALSLIRRRGADPVLASFGAFCALYGIRLIFKNPMTTALGISGSTAIWVDSLVTYTILVPAWTFFWKTMGDGWRRLTFWWVRLVAVFAIVAIATDVVLRSPGSLGKLNNLIVLLGLVVIALGLRTRPEWMKADMPILTVGLSVFALSAINENLVPLGLVPWSWRWETAGFLVFVVSLGWIAARRFVATERNLAIVQGELEAAKKIQSSILPSNPPVLEDLVIASRFRPSSAVAGDLYDFLRPTAHEVGIVIADVSGHGIPAALIASMVKVAFASRADCADRPAELLTLVNQALCGSFQHGFVSAAYVHLDTRQRQAIVACGGHPFPLLRRRSEPRPREIGGRGSILGRFPQATFEEHRLSLEPGDRLLLYTDGIVEARNAFGEMFGEARLRTLLEESGGLSSDGFCDAVMDELSAWLGGSTEAPREDDLTLVVVDVSKDGFSAGRSEP